MSYNLKCCSFYPNNFDASALGLEVGSDRHIIASLPTLGVEALLLSVCATVGSCVLAWALWKTAKKGGGEQ